jgi:hypothetical protein
MTHFYNIEIRKSTLKKKNLKSLFSFSVFLLFFFFKKKKRKSLCCVVVYADVHNQTSTATY